MVRAAAAGVWRDGLCDSRALRGCAGAAAMDGELGRALSGATPRRSQPGGVPAPAAGTARRHSEPAGGAADPTAGHVQDVRRAHRYGDLRGRSRHPGGPVLLQTAAGSAGTVLGVSSNQDEPRRQPQHHPREPLLSLCVPELRDQSQAATAGLPDAEVGSRPALPGHRRVPLPKERPGQRSLPAARLLSPGLHRSRGGGTAGGSHVGGDALRPSQGHAGSVALRPTWGEAGTPSPCAPTCSRRGWPSGSTSSGVSTPRLTSTSAAWSSFSSAWSRAGLKARSTMRNWPLTAWWACSLGI